MMKKTWKLYLIQHSHTDIGYTDRQEKIERYHVDFIKSVIDSLDSIENARKKNGKAINGLVRIFGKWSSFLKTVMKNTDKNLKSM